MSKEAIKLAKHGGNVAMLAKRLGIKPDEIIDYSSNINPFGPPPSVIEAMRIALSKISEYPEPNAESFVESVSAAIGLPQENIIAGNGSIELLDLIARTARSDKALLLVPSFTEYELALIKAGVRVEYASAMSAKHAIKVLKTHAKDSGLIMLGNPNNPCGYSIEREELLELIDHYKKVTWVIDEAFIDFVIDGDSYSVINNVLEFENLMVVRSLTKIFGLAGVRLGYAASSTKISEKLREAKYPWSINAIAIAAGIAALKEVAFVEETSSKIASNAQLLFDELSSIEGLGAFEPSANYILVKIDSHIKAADLQIEMLKCGIAIRDCSSYTGLNDNYFRIAVKTIEQNTQLISHLKKALKGLL